MLGMAERTLNNALETTGNAVLTAMTQKKKFDLTEKVRTQITEWVSGKVENYLQIRPGDGPNIDWRRYHSASSLLDSGVAGQQNCAQV